MRVIKPIKVPILHRVIELNRRPILHVAAMLGHRLDDPRALLDELAFWTGASASLGDGILDEAIAKPCGELLVAGDFHAVGGEPVTASFVRVCCGAVDKRLSVVGNRSWKEGVPSEPEPIVTIPIDWAHAFGGPSHDRNPYGVGAEPIKRDGTVVHPLPNVECWGRLMRSPSERPEPASYRPMDVSFAQRRKRAGTYDQAWLQQDFPGMPPDADPHFFNLAPQDQWTVGFWRGDEEYVVENMHPTVPRLHGRFPGLIVRAFAALASGDPGRCEEIPLCCDTLWLFPGAGWGAVIFHGAIEVTSDDAADVRTMVIGCEDPNEPRTREHYEGVLARRLDKDQGPLDALSDAELMPSSRSGVAADFGNVDIGQWVQSENLHAHKQRTGAERQRVQWCEEARAAGFDPKVYGLDVPPPAILVDPPRDLASVAAYVREQEAQAAAFERAAEDEQVRARERARQQYAELGLDYDEETMRMLREHGGPPRFSAQSEIDQLAAEARAAREAGAPLEGVEHQLADPSFSASLFAQERALGEMYRTAAHLQPAPLAAGEERSRHARVVAQAALDSGESLAERDFTGVDWSGMKLAGIDLRGAFLEASNLEGCDLSGANLERAVLAKSNLRGAVLAGAKLGGANLGAATLQGAVLDRADLTAAIVSRAALGGASLKEVKLDGADLLFTKFERADLSGARLPGANILNADLTGCRFVGADLSDANLVECTLDGTDFTRATLQKTTFVTCKGQGTSFRQACLKQAVLVHGSELPGADLRDADLEKANLRGTALVGAKLDRANLAGGDLSECDCTGASLERIVLKEGLAIRTKLTRASLRGANLMDLLMSKAEVQGADFTGANLARADLSRVVGDVATSFAEAEVAQVRFLPKANPPPEGGAS